MREAGERRVSHRAESGPVLRTPAPEWTHSRSPARPGHGDVFADVARRYQPLLRGVARRILRDEDQAQDAVQEALLSLWQAAETPRSLRGWLVRAVIHRSLHARRSRDRRRHWEGVAGDLLARDCPLCDPERRLDARRGLRDLERALESLPEDQRSVFLLRELEGLEYREIARRLALPVGTVRSRLNRARRRLQPRSPATSGGALPQGAA